MGKYRWRSEQLPALDLAGYTKVVGSGGEMYDAVRGDGRWEALRELGGDDSTIYGVASLDADCPQGRYRYTLAVRCSDRTRSHEGLCTMHVPAAEWVVFSLDSFLAQYGAFWTDNPYALLQEAGWEFDRAVGLHIDVFAPAFVADADGMEFMMPARRRA